MKPFIVNVRSDGDTSTLGGVGKPPKFWGSGNVAYTRGVVCDCPFTGVGRGPSYTTSPVMVAPGFVVTRMSSTSLVSDSGIIANSPGSGGVRGSAFGGRTTF